MNRHLVRVQQRRVALEIRAMFRGELRDPRTFLGAVETAFAIRGELFQHQPGIADDAHFDLAVMANFLAVEIDVDKFRVG